jgi:hypothetical protein
LFRNKMKTNAVIQLFRIPAIRSFILLLLAVQLTNVSIDPQDPEANGSHEISSLNEYESFVELILEDFLGLTDCIEEGDETDNDSNRTLLKTYFINNRISAWQSSFTTLPLAANFMEHPSSLLQGYFPDFNPPPWRS